MRLRYLALIVLLLAIAMAVACSSSDSGSNTSGESSSPTMTVAVHDCGSGAFSTLAQLDAASLTTGEVGADSQWRKQSGQTKLTSLGDASFAAAIDAANFKWGSTTLFSKGMILSGGNGRLVTSILVNFNDESSAALLIEHPNLGQTKTLRDVATDRYGDDTKALYFETVDGFVGYVIQFRVGTIVAYIGDVGSGETPAFADGEHFADVVCANLRTAALTQ
jgi:hypothetical protein